MIWRLSKTVAMLIVLSVCAAAVPKTASAGEDPASPLEQIIPELKFDDVPLEQAIDEIRERWKANIVVDWAGMLPGKTDTVKLHLWKITVRAAVAEIFNSVRSGAVVFQIDDGVLNVVAPGWSFDPDNVHMYDIQTLIVAAIERKRAARDAADPQKTSVIDALSLSREAEDELIQLVSEFALPDPNGSTPPAVRFRAWNGRLFVAAPPEIQMRVSKFLDRAREPKRAATQKSEKS